MSEEILKLAGKLGIGPKQLEGLKVKYKNEETLHRTLKRWVEETTETPRFMAKGSGYTDIPSKKMGASPRRSRGNLVEEPEAVDEECQDRLTATAKMKQIREAANNIDTAATLLSLIDETTDPTFRRSARLTLHRIESELKRFIEQERRRVA